MSDSPKFLFAVCQVGAEPALKAEVARRWPGFRFAYSRPGFVTFKLPEGEPPAEDFDLCSTFARTYGFSLGDVRGEDGRSLADHLWNIVGEREFQHLHVWQRDTATPGENGFEPGETALAGEIARLIASRAPDGRTLKLNQTARSGQLVLDCVLVEPNQWWFGLHRASSMPSRWPGGVCKVRLPDHALTRAYLKMEEALRWSRLPIRAGDQCVEIGSSPGGAAQSLLDRGLHVIGIDPADMEPAVLAHPHFIHVRKRGRDVRRKEFRAIRWLFADSNVAPKHTLDTVEDIVTHEDVHVRGMLITLKLFDWKLADEIPVFLARIRSWGFSSVSARQLAFNRQEICVAALRNRAMRRIPPKKKQKRVKTEDTG